MTDHSERDDLVQVGETGSAHGIEGEIRIFTAEPNWDYFSSGHEVYLVASHATDTYEIESWRVAEDFAIAKFCSVDDRGEAERLTNRDVAVPADILPDLGEREFYHHDLEGRGVFVPTGGEPRRIGEVEGVFSTGANDVLVVRRDRAEDVYVPMFEGAIDELEPDGDRILLHPPDQWAPDATDI